MALTGSSNSTMPFPEDLELVAGGLDAKRPEQGSEHELGEAAVGVHVESHEDVTGAVRPSFSVMAKEEERDH
ncbi:hypothetical protein Pyn_01600 [Prunus yedoensis var. nudiflora]|uniref:Uncharacterized protein n=1 Tax=Prunus yedoensis var. nudiflora TaxID=2094558 RepID=A0A314ZAT8_PRUYE|nr:hypothetical protein Pyn_01600 [Prunus yedoensis var. nudiflora]